MAHMVTNMAQVGSPTHRGLEFRLVECGKPFEMSNNRRESAGSTTEGEVGTLERYLRCLQALAPLTLPGLARPLFLLSRRSSSAASSLRESKEMTRKIPVIKKLSF